ALFLRFWRGMTPRAIAALLAVSEPTIRSRIERALVRLRRQLDTRDNGRSDLDAWAALAAGLPGNSAVMLSAVGLLMNTKLVVGASVVIAVLVSLPFLRLGEATAIEPHANGLTMAQARATTDLETD